MIWGSKAAMAVARDFYGRLTEFALEGLAAFAVAGVASGVGYAVVFWRGPGAGPSRHARRARPAVW